MNVKVHIQEEPRREQAIADVMALSRGVSAVATDARAVAPVDAGASPHATRGRCHQGQADREPDPEPDHAPPELERDERRERQANQPVTDELASHRRPRIAEPAQRAGRHALHAVKQLEGGGDPQQATPVAITAASRVKSDASPRGAARNTMAATPMNVAADRDRRPAGRCRAGRVAPSDRVPDADRAGGRQAERHHERDAGDVQRDLMRCERDGIDTSCERGNGPEDADLALICMAAGAPRRSSRHTRSHSTCRNETSDRPTRLTRSWRMMTPSRQQAMKTRAMTVAHAEPVTPSAGNPRCPKIEDPIEEGVDDVRREERNHHRPNDSQRLQVAPERGIEQERKRAHASADR